MSYDCWPVNCRNMIRVIQNKIVAIITDGFYTKSVISIMISDTSFYFKMYFFTEIPSFFAYISSFSNSNGAKLRLLLEFELDGFASSWLLKSFTSISWSKNSAYLSDSRGEPYLIICNFSGVKLTFSSSNKFETFAGTELKGSLIWITFELFSDSDYSFWPKSLLMYDFLFF